MCLFQLVILCGQLFHIHFTVWELPGQLSSGGVELFQFRFMLGLVLGSGLLKLDFLDVYKRQVITISQQIIVITDLNEHFIISGTLQILPVSYTHLDVYKRQQH